MRDMIVLYDLKVPLCFRVDTYILLQEMLSIVQ